MTKFQYAMIMFTLVVIIGKVSPPTEQGLWSMVSGAWFMVMIINLTSQLITYGKENKNNKKDN